MKTIIKNKNTISEKDNIIILSNKKSKLTNFNLSSDEIKYVNKQQKRNKEIIILNQYTRKIIIINPEDKNNNSLNSERIRCLGDEILNEIINFESITVENIEKDTISTYDFLEGLSLGNYTFDNHKSKKEKEKELTIYVYNNNDKNIAEIESIANSVRLTKDLVNTPFSHLKATDLARLAKKAGEESGFKTTIYNKKKIQSLKMGGILAVNQGSIDEPTFSILEWKPKNAKNTKPIVLVGKGIVYDTGGLSLKATKNGMEFMKVDMAGAGTVIGAMHAIATNKIPKHVIGLVPATDNRPSGNAYAPGDVVTMFNQSTVEVLNTDAEGRMILADALSYAEKYNPELVIDLATLTGSAANTIGHFGIVSMQKNARNQHDNLEKIGHKTHERLAEMPFWDDYDELIKSDIADIKNIGGAFGGAITAGKFLSNFINYPWIHLDIAGPAYVTTKYNYRGKGATGMGVRLLYNYVKEY